MSTQLTKKSLEGNKEASIKKIFELTQTAYKDFGQQQNKEDLKYLTLRIYDEMKNHDIESVVTIFNRILRRYDIYKRINFAAFMTERQNLLNERSMPSIKDRIRAQNELYGK